MQLRRIAVSAAVLLTTLVSGATSAAAGPASPATTPPTATAETDVFPGAQPGVRTGPLATSILPVPKVRPKGLVGDPFTGFTCDGTTGTRVEVLYVREATMPDRYLALQPIIQSWLITADAAFNDGAARGGQSRHMRYLTETVGGSCQAVVDKVLVPAGSLADFGKSVDAVAALGFNRNDRKYIMLTEGSQVCGVGGKYDDDTPGAGNLSNSFVTYARVDAIAGCLGANAIAHEFAHSIGAVQNSAPHSDGSSHCTQRFDMMCYGGTPTYDCTEWDAERLPDCGADDYFNVAPATGNYLATHWNLANSIFFRTATTTSNTNYPRPGSTYTVKNVLSGKALDIDPAGGTVSDPLAYLYATTASTTSASQKWLLGYQTGTQIMNNKSLQCLDSAYSGTTPGTRSLQYLCAGQDGMRWGYLPHSDGSFSVLNWLTGLALTQGDSTTSLVDQQVYTGNANQRWTFTKIADPAPIATNSTYYVSALSNRETVASPAAGVVGSAITHAAPGTATTQRWKLVAQGAYYQLVNGANALCASNNNVATAGITLTLRTCSSTLTGQQWKLRRVADGRYMLVNRFSNLALTMTDGAGSGLQQQALSVDNRAQDFAFALV
jgi:hypothetical protein